MDNLETAMQNLDIAEHGETEDGLINTCDEDELLKQVQQVTAIEQRDWADVPMELLSEIFSRIVGGDRIMFQLACKWWKSVLHVKSMWQRPNFLKSGAPYLMMSNKNKIFDPIHQEYQCIDFHRPAGQIWAVKDGWLLMTYRYNQIFFYNPFTKDQVKLPNHPRELLVPETVCFSSPLTSTDWVVVVLVSSYTTDGIDIYSLGCKDEIWNHYELTYKDYECLGQDYRDSIICKGLYYFLDRDAKLMIHDSLTKKFHFHKPPESISQILIDKGCQKYMLESNGKVLVVIVNVDGSIVSTFSWINETWEAISCLEEESNMLFVSRISSFCERATIQGTGNKIYFPIFIGDQSLFYSLSTKRYHTFEMGTSYESLCGLKFFIRSGWIKP